MQVHSAGKTVTYVRHFAIVSVVRSKKCDQFGLCVLSRTIVTIYF